VLDPDATLLLSQLKPILSKPSLKKPVKHVETLILSIYWNSFKYEVFKTGITFYK